MKWFRRIAGGVIALAVLGYCGVLAYVFVDQRALQYEAGGKMFALSETALKHAQLVSIPSGEGSGRSLG